MRTLTLTLFALTLGAALFAGTALAQTQGPASPIWSSRPAFNLGFRLLAERIPEVVGDPLENEHWGANGDSLQQTSTGLMVWRKADNWTAFTNGSRTWINGPAGVQSRTNDERFGWEGSPTTAPTKRDEITMYDRRGVPTAYIAVDDQNTIYMWTGEPVAYLYEDHVYGFNGRHIGWFQDGIIWDYEAVAVGFTAEAQGGSHTGDPIKPPRLPKPSKLPMEPAPPEPLTTRDVYTTLLSGVLRIGQLR